MFSAFRTFGRMGAPAGRTLAQQIAAMSPSLWLEPSVTNGYQDSAGPTALTQPGGGAADPPVGLALDLSQGAQLGPELVSNPGGPFVNTTGYTVEGNASISVVAGALRLVSGDSPAYQTGFRFNVSVVAGKSYKVVVSGTGSSYRCAVLSPFQTINGNPTSFIFRADGATSIYVYSNLPSAGLITDFTAISVREIKGNHALQSTSTARPKLSARVNLLTGTTTLATQSVTVTAAAHTIDWSGAGTITASGAHSGALSKGQTFTPSAGTLTLTVSGSVTSASLVLGASVGTYQAVTDANNYAYAGWPLIHQFDGVDDVLNVTFPSSLGSDCTVVTANRGATPTILTGQTIGTSYTINTTNAGRLVFPRALTAAETAIVTRWATQKWALPA